MARYSIAVLIILIAFLTHSLGVHVSYKNESSVVFHLRENITLSCTGEDEVVWRVRSISTNYSVKVETPYRKIIEIRNATVENIGFYDCYSKGNQDDLMRLGLVPHVYAYLEMGYKIHGESQRPVVIPP